MFYFWDSRLSSICHFNATTFALFPSSSTNWRGYPLLSHWSDQFLYWCSNSILKIKSFMKVCFDQASLTREILYVPTWQVNDRWRDFDAILECGRQSVKWAFIASAPLRSLLPSSPLPFFSTAPPSPSPSPLRLLRRLHNIQLSELYKNAILAHNRSCTVS